MNGSTVQSVTKTSQVETQGKSGKIESKTSVTREYVTGSTASSTSGYAKASPSPGPPPASKKQLQFAIFSHIKAVRALGRTEINTQEIADALDISVKEVNDVIEVLKKLGVRRR